MTTTTVHEFFSRKDIARILCVSERTVKRWSELLGICPTIGGHACHRWSKEDMIQLIEQIAAKKKLSPTIYA